MKFNLFGGADGIENQLRQKIVYTDERAPQTSDQGLMWFHLNGAQIDLYVKNLITGVWAGPTTI